MSEGTVYGNRFQQADLPRAYDAELVPRVFDPWARELLDALNPQPGEHALDVACGPGTVARQLAQRVGPAGHVTGADHQGRELEADARDAAGNLSYEASAARLPAGRHGNARGGERADPPLRFLLIAGARPRAIARPGRRR